MASESIYTFATRLSMALQLTHEMPDSMTSLSDSTGRPYHYTVAAQVLCHRASQSTAHADSVPQEAPRQILSTAERPLPGRPQSQQGILQEALPLPALVAPALAAANEDHAYLRWKAVIHSMPANTAAAAQGPDFPAARWFHDQMSYRHGSAAAPYNQGRWIRSCCCCCCLCRCLSHCSVWPWAALTALGLQRQNRYTLLAVPASSRWLRLMQRNPTKSCQNVICDSKYGSKGRMQSHTD